MSCRAGACLQAAGYPRTITLHISRNKIEEAHMKSVQRLGGWASLAQVVLFLLTLVFIFGLLPGQGITDPSALGDPAVVLASAARSPVVPLLNWLDVPFSVTTMVLVLVMYERLHAGGGIHIRLASVSGLAAAVILLILGAVGYSAVQQLAGLYGKDQAGASAGYLGLYALTSALQIANVFAYGWWLLLVSWSDLSQHTLPRILDYLGVVYGLIGILAFAFPVLGFVGILVGIIWFGWLGIRLLRE
jgi:hypothetical protein